MLVAPHTLSIITTHRCTAACDHCCFDCTSDRGHPSIPIPNIHRYIEQASEVKSFRLVVFTGGECFLLGRDLDDCVSTATRQGFKSRFVSNGYWATSPAVARRRLESLQSRGLLEANFSTGDAHMAYVRPEYVRNGAMAAADLGLTVFIMLELHAGSRFDFEGFVGEPAFRPYLESKRVVIQNSPWMRFNGKESLAYTREYMQDMSNGRQRGCSTILNVIAITPTESLVSCCGLTLEQIEELHLGSLRERTVGEILRSAPDDFLKVWVHLQGPDAVLRYARSVDPTIGLPDNSAHICEICRSMYHDPKVVAAVMRNPPPFRAALMQEYVMNLVKPIAESQFDSSTAAYKEVCTVKRMRTMRKTALVPA
ncbi:MAG TPA: hypothetical protein PLX89_06365 [Verrucomicrobiota bacterium]|nr:hypothetical protein [Verrucomicrobiales bacterium]HRI12614.1 hypothetical protein [Verrucomicrobiota bacterium]